MAHMEGERDQISEFAFCISFFLRGGTRLGDSALPLGVHTCTYEWVCVSAHFPFLSRLSRFIKTPSFCRQVQNRLLPKARDARCRDYAINRSMIINYQGDLIEFVSQKHIYCRIALVIIIN